MRKVILTSLIVVLALSIGAAFANPDGTCDGKMIGKVNIIGVKNPKSDNMDDNGGGVIFVDLFGKNKIYLVDSNDVDGLDPDDFEVLDKNATDSDGGLLAIPNPGLDPYLVGDTTGKDTIADYSIFVRPLGKPDGWATITTCADLMDSTFAGLLPGSLVSVLNRQPDEVNEPDTYCSIEQVGQEITLRTNGKEGKTTFTNVTAELLTIVFQVTVDTDPTEGVTLETVCVRVPVFDDILENEYWEYDNHGLKLLQVRFYDCTTDVSLDDGDLSGPGGGC